MPDRAAVFMDGANIYRAFKEAFGSARYSPWKLAVELSAGRQLVEVDALTRPMQVREPDAVPERIGYDGWWNSPEARELK